MSSPLVPTPTDAVGIASYFLSQQLSGSLAIQASGITGIYEDLAPEGTKPPYLVFAWQGGVDNNKLGPVRTSATQRYIVKAIAAGRGKQLISAVMHAVDIALQGQTLQLTVPGTEFSGVFSCVRLSSGSIGDQDLGKEYRQIYQIWEIDLREPTT